MLFKPLFIAFLFAGSTALAQDRQVDTFQKTANWSSIHTIREKDKVEVVTLAEPTRTQDCYVTAFDADRLTCGKHKGSKPASFQRDEVVALIRPAYHESHWAELALFSGFFAGGGAIVYSAAVIASVATPLIVLAIPVAIVGAIMAFCSPVLFIGDYPASILYLRAGEHLQAPSH